MRNPVVGRQLQGLGVDHHESNFFRSGAEQLLKALEANGNVTADVGQVYFGGAVTISADRPLEHRLWKTTGKEWVNLDSELETGCGIVPYSCGRVKRR